MERGTDAREPANAVTALQVMILPGRQGQGLSKLCLEKMRSNVSNHGFAHLVAPVRPSWKARYPLVPIERYISWTTEDGLPVDPWLRVHARLGAEIVRPCPESMTITGTVSEWEGWTSMLFPEGGDYVVPGRSGARLDRPRGGPRDVRRTKRLDVSPALISPPGA